MLKRIRLKDFKSFVNEEVELAPLTLLVGANASGKSNFLDALRFLKGIASHLTLSEVLNGERSTRPDSWSGIRGRAEEAVRFGTNWFEIASTWLLPETERKLEVEYQHRIACHVAAPVVTALEERFYDPIRNISVERSGGVRSILSPLDNFGKDRRNYSLVDGLRELLIDLSFLDIKPSAMRGYGIKGNLLGEDGRNVSGVLADLCEDPDAKHAFIYWLSELCAPEIEDLDFVGVEELGDVMAMFIEKGGKRISTRSVSDGTLQFLGTVLALRTAEPGSTILIEEIGAGLHPTRIRLLVDYLETVTREGNLQVIATTHSPVVLQWLEDEILRNTIVFGRVPEHEGTMMRRLGDLPHFEEVVQKAGIDEMFTTGWLEMAL